MGKRIVQIMPATDWFAIRGEKDENGEFDCFPIAAFALIEEDGETFVDAVADSDMDLYSELHGKYNFLHISQIIKTSVYKCRQKGDDEE